MRLRSTYNIASMVQPRPRCGSSHRVPVLYATDVQLPRDCMASIGLRPVWSQPSYRPRHFKLYSHCTRGRCLRRGFTTAGFRRGSPRPALLGVPSVFFDTTPVINVIGQRRYDQRRGPAPRLRLVFSSSTSLLLLLHARAPLCVPFDSALRTSTRARTKRQATAARRSAQGRCG